MRQKMLAHLAHLRPVELEKCRNHREKPASSRPRICAPSFAHLAHLRSRLRTLQPFTAPETTSSCKPGRQGRFPPRQVGAVCDQRGGIASRVKIVHAPKPRNSG